jgi:osmoprotectant transport system substrate-binding protein
MAAAAALVCAVLLAGCGSSANLSSANFAPATAVVSPPDGQPGAGKPPVTLGTKNFTEESILGQLYAQALQAKGFTVRVVDSVGPTEVIDPELLRGHIDLYPEYTGVIVSTLSNITPAAPGAAATGPLPPRSWQEAYSQAAQFEDRRGFTLLAPTPFQDADRVAVLPEFAKAHGLRSMDDLAKLPSFTNGGPPENQTRYEGIVGMRQAYGITNAVFVPYVIGQQYQALDEHRVDTIAIFTTDGQLAANKYVILSDPKNIFGYQNVAPVVNKTVIEREGPGFAQTLNAVSSRLTTQVMQRLNGEVVLAHRSPADVASAFLANELSLGAAR